MNYGFCYADNVFDSYEFPVRVGVPIEKIFQPALLIDLEWTAPNCHLIRLKRDQICDVLLGFLRANCKARFLMRQHKVAKGGETSKAKFSRRVLLTRPTNLPYELMVMTYYLQICTYIQSQMNVVSTLE